MTTHQLKKTYALFMSLHAICYRYVMLHYYIFLTILENDNFVCLAELELELCVIIDSPIFTGAMLQCDCLLDNIKYFIHILCTHVEFCFVKEETHKNPVYEG